MQARAGRHQPRCDKGRKAQSDRPAASQGRQSLSLSDGQPFPRNLESGKSLRTAGRFVATPAPRRIPFPTVTQIRSGASEPTIRGRRADARTTDRTRARATLRAASLRPGAIVGGANGHGPTDHGTDGAYSAPGHPPVQARGARDHVALHRPTTSPEHPVNPPALALPRGGQLHRLGYLLRCNAWGAETARPITGQALAFYAKKIRDTPCKCQS